MLFHPTVMALLLWSAAAVGATAAAAAFAWTILREWNPASGSARQLELERRTYLISTLMVAVLVGEAVSLLLFVFNADSMAVMFVGAMCAVGTLNASPYGFPALIAKIVVFFLAVIWLAFNRADNHGWDYPLIRPKYRLLLAIFPVVVGSAALQLAYFADLRADVLVSCCSKLFVPEQKGVAAHASGLPAMPSLAAFYVVTSACVAMGWGMRRRPGLAVAYSPLAATAFVVAMAAVVSVLSTYVYEQPHHHCPFCILKPEYGYVGYALYVPLFLGTGLGMAIWPINRYRAVPSLAEAVPAMVARMAAVSAGSFLGLIAVGSAIVAVSNLRYL